VLHERLVRLMGSADAATARRARACLLQAVTQAAAAGRRGPVCLARCYGYWIRAVAWDF